MENKIDSTENFLFNTLDIIRIVIKGLFYFALFMMSLIGFCFSIICLIKLYPQFTDLSLFCLKYIKYLFNIISAIIIIYIYFYLIYYFYIKTKPKKEERRKQFKEELKKEIIKEIKHGRNN